MKNMENTKFVSVCQPSNTIQAGLIRSTLEEANIVCYVNNEEGAGVRFGGMGIGAAGMNVMVPEEQADQAVALIAELGIE